MVVPDCGPITGSNHPWLHVADVVHTAASQGFSMTDDEKPKAPKSEDDDVRAWIVIGIISGAITLALTTALVWDAVSG